MDARLVELFSRRSRKTLDNDRMLLADQDDMP
jgi:hypothetical protein